MRRPKARLIAAPRREARKALLREPDSTFEAPVAVPAS